MFVLAPICGLTRVCLSGSTTDNIISYHPDTVANYPFLDLLYRYFSQKMILFAN